jgi:PKD repeat protein
MPLLSPTFTFSATLNPPVGEPLFFHDTTYNPPSDPILSRNWVFNSGEELPAADITVVRSFKTSGIKTVTLTVTNSSGSVSVSHDVTIYDTTHFSRDYSIDATTPELDKSDLRIAGPILYQGNLLLFIGSGTTDPGNQFIRTLNIADGSPIAVFPFPEPKEIVDVSRPRMCVLGTRCFFVGNTSRLYYIDNLGGPIQYFEYSGWHFKGVTVRKITVGSQVSDGIWVLAAFGDQPYSTFAPHLLAIDPTTGGIIYEDRKSVV